MALTKNMSCIPGKEYDSQDEAGANAVLHAILQTAKEYGEWGGFIYQIGAKFSYGAPRKGLPSMIDERWYAPVPTGALVVADYHTHTSKPDDWMDEECRPFDPDDAEAYKYNNRTGYLGVLDGHRLWQGKIWRLKPNQRKPDFLIVITY